MTNRESLELFLVEFARGLAIYGSLSIVMLVVYVLFAVDSYQ